MKSNSLAISQAPRESMVYTDVCIFYTLTFLMLSLVNIRRADELFPCRFTGVETHRHAVEPHILRGHSTVENPSTPLDDPKLHL